MEYFVLFLKKKAFVRPLLLVIVYLLTLQLTGFAKSIDVYANSSSLTVSVVDGISININSVSLDGIFATSDTTTPNISIYTDNGTGYTLGVFASNEGNNALNSANGSIPSITESGGISESTYKNDPSYINTWGFRPSKLNSSDNDYYYPAPASTSVATILDRTSVANSVANTYNLAIGTKVNTAVAPGSYSNTFVIAVVANPAVYSITYNDNSSGAGSGFPANILNQNAIDETVYLSPTVPTRNGFDFAGWCTVNVADDASCTGISYAVGDAWVLDQTLASNSLTLYARWTSRTYNLSITFAGSGVSNVKICKVSGNCDGNNLVGTISFSGGSVSGLILNGIYYLYPSFNNNYELESWTNTGSYGTLSSTSITNPSYTIGQGNGTITITGKIHGPPYCTSSQLCMQTMTFSECPTSSTTAYDGRDGNSYTIRKINNVCWMTQNLRTTGTVSAEWSNFNGNDFNVSKYDISSASVSQCAYGNGFSYPCTKDSGSTSTGVWYNYYSATAGTISGSSNATAASSDICPSGWRLPTYTEQRNIMYYSSYFSGVTGGAYSDGSIYGTQYGRWWSATSSDSASRQTLYYDGSSLGTIAISRYNGLYIRCVRST